MIPFFIYYSMFGFQRIGDLIWAAGDMRCRGFVLGGTAGRTTLAGEGLQHQDGNSHLNALAFPTVMAYDPCYAYELSVIVLDGIRKMYYEDQDVFYYITLMNENYEMPILPLGSTEGISKGIYRLSERPWGRSTRGVRLFGSGAILRETLRAQDLLEQKFGVASSVYSVTSYKNLYYDGRDCDRWNRLHPGEAPRRPYVEQVLDGAVGADRGGLRLRRCRAPGDRPLGRSRLHGAGHRRLRPQRGPRGPAAVLRGRRREHRPDGAGATGPQGRIPQGEAGRSDPDPGARSEQTEPGGKVKGEPIMNRFSLILAVVLAAGGTAAPSAETKGKPMSYGEAREFLVKHTELVELTNGEGARVAVCPQWQGRVMTSTCGGMEGPSFGFINDEFITAGKPNLHFNNYGAEERLWLSPEGGQFSLWFEPGKPQNLDNWFTPPAFNEGAWKVVSAPADAAPHGHDDEAPEHLGHAAASRRQPRRPLAGQFRSAADPRRGSGEEDRRPGREERGLRDRQPLDQPRRRHDPRERPGFDLDPGHDELRAADGGDRALQAGRRGRVGPVVKSDYFGAVPHQRLRTLPEAVLLRADGNWRSKIGISQRRARNLLGSIDFQNNVLTLVHFSMPADPTRELYMNNQWGGPLAEPYRGDVANSYNDGPPAPGKKGSGPSTRSNRSRRPGP